MSEESIQVLWEKLRIKLVAAIYDPMYSHDNEEEEEEEYGADDQSYGNEGGYSDSSNEAIDGENRNHRQKSDIPDMGDLLNFLSKFDKAPPQEDTTQEDNDTQKSIMTDLFEEDGNNQ